MTADPTAFLRRHDLDWLRVLAILTVFIFHSGRFFDRMDWHVKNPTLTGSAQIITMFLASWIMPLIFVISGASLYFGLGSALKFIKDKSLRLLVPLMVGVFTHVAIGVYLERLSHHQFTGSFIDFYPLYFKGLYGEGGNFAWMGLHLWYLLVLFVFSLALLPLLLLLKGRWRSALAWMGRTFSNPILLYLLAIPAMLLIAFVNPRTILGEHSWGGWNLASYLPFLLLGFLLISSDAMQTAVKRCRWVSLALAVICCIVLAQMNARYGFSPFGSAGYTQVNSLFGLNAWLWILAIFGFGMHHLNRGSRFLAYANEAVLPFYILHQTVLLIIGYYITRLSLPDAVKFILISGCSFIVILAIYEGLVRRVNFMRVLFGMKSVPKK